MSAAALEKWAEAIGWIAALALLLNLVAFPVASFVLPLYGVTPPEVEPLDLAEVFAIVGSAVGVGYVKRPALTPPDR